MALADGVVAARHIGQTITWTDEDGTVLDLTGATITGFVRPNHSGTVRAIDGVLVLSDAVNGVFTWAYGANDVSEYGDFEVQFVATYTLLEKTILMAWHVHEGLSV